MDNIKKSDTFILGWKRKIALLVKENPELKEMTGELHLHLYKGQLQKCKIAEKEI